MKKLDGFDYKKLKPTLMTLVLHIRMKFTHIILKKLCGDT